MPFVANKMPVEIAMPIVSKVLKSLVWIEENATNNNPNTIGIFKNNMTSKIHLFCVFATVSSGRLSFSSPKMKSKNGMIKKT
jgi:hypothetical protein